MKRFLCIIGLLLGTAGSLICLGFGCCIVYVAAEVRQFTGEATEKFDQSVDELREQLVSSRNQVQASGRLASRVSESFSQRQPGFERLGKSSEIRFKIQELLVAVGKAEAGLDFLASSSALVQWAVECCHSLGIPIEAETLSILVAEVQRLDVQLADLKQQLEQFRDSAEEALPQRREQLRDLLQKATTVLRTIALALESFDQRLQNLQQEVQVSTSALLGWLRLFEVIAVALLLWLTFAQGTVAWRSWKALRCSPTTSEQNTNSTLNA